MNWKLFIAQRIYRSNENEKGISKPAVRIAVAGIAIGLAVMIVSVAVVLGFKNEVRNKVVGIGADVLITNFDAQKSYETVPILASDSILHQVQAVAGVSHTQCYSTKPGMITTSDNFLGMVLKGVNQSYDWAFMRQHLLEGEIPIFTDSVASNQTLLSRTIANKLHLKLGDRLHTYYIDGEEVRARRLTVAGIYQTNFSVFDDHFLVTDIYTVNRLNGWKAGQVSGIEIAVSDFDQVASVASELHDKLGIQLDQYGGTYYVQTIEEANPQIFAWLDLLDMNVWVILCLMTGVAGFTMISGLLILILERTNMIGVLKALGADNLAIRKIFLTFAMLLVGKGMLWGNLIGLGFCAIQYFLAPFKLDSSIYYVESVPILLHPWIYLLLNAATLLVSILMLVAPSYLITHIHPAKSIRFE
ncbi:MAG: ABC transporter permease [Phocaeicola sp.]